MDERIVTSRSGRVQRITIARPEAHNALDAAMHRAMSDAFDAFEADNDLWIAVITGSGAKAFCAGHDLRQQDTGGGIQLPAAGFGGLTARHITKPVIALVNGAAMGGGFELALACDIILAADTAVFALPEALVGLAPVGGGMQRLPRSIGSHRALALMMTGDRLAAAEARELGLVAEVVPAGELEATCDRWVARLLRASPLALRAIKDCVAVSYDLPLVDMMAAQWQRPAVAAMFASDDAREGPRAFVERRTPGWSGR